MKIKKWAGFMTAAMIFAGSSPAFATHAYRSVVCKSETLLLTYDGHFVGGEYGLSKLGTDRSKDPDSRFKASFVGDEYGAEDAQVSFKQVSSTVTKEKVTSKDCWFDHNEWQTRQVLRIEKASDAALDKLDVKLEAEIPFICDEATDIPNGNHCEKP